mgnify:CR=1
MLRNTHFFSGCSTGNSKQRLVASIHFEKQIHTNFENSTGIETLAWSNIE